MKRLLVAIAWAIGACIGIVWSSILFDRIDGNSPDLWFVIFVYAVATIVISLFAIYLLNKEQR